MTLNDIIQWSSVAAILLIVLVTIIRKIVRFNRSLGSDASLPCSSCNAEAPPSSTTNVPRSCTTCASNCPLRR